MWCIYGSGPSGALQKTRQVDRPPRRVGMPALPEVPLSPSEACYHAKPVLRRRSQIFVPAVGGRQQNRTSMVDRVRAAGTNLRAL